MRHALALLLALALGPALSATGTAAMSDSPSAQAEALTLSAASLTPSAQALTGTALALTGSAQALSGTAAVAKKKPRTKLAVITLAKGGVIKFKFYAKDAPKTVENFISLAKKGFYDGLSFHRVEPGFVVQGGDPAGNGSGGPGYTIKGEFSDTLKHVEGAVAMARTNDPDSAGSQFYICLAPAPFLDGKYAIFGQVVEGMDLVHQIAVGDKMAKVEIVEE
jgi:peptidyl-prolyl cis-trans isomerase B (cyclophilin B)